MPKLNPTKNQLSYPGSGAANGSVHLEKDSMHETEHALLNSLPSLIASVDKNLKYKYINASYQDWLGRNAGEIVGKSVIDVLGADVYNSVRLQIARALRGERCQFEYFVVNRKGLRFIDATYIPAFDHDHQVTGYTEHLIDVTDKTRSERALKDYVQNANIGLHWVDENGTIIWANAAEMKLLGYTQDEYIGHHVSEFHANRHTIDDILKRLACNEVLHDYEAVLRCKDGSTKDVVINSSVYWENGKFVHTRCFTVDITSRKQAELKLKRSEAQFRQLANSLPVAFYTCDSHGSITRYNDVAVKLWGYKPETGSDSLKFCAFSKVWTTDGTYVPPEKTPMADAIQTGKAFRDVEVVMERHDGSKFYACVNIDPIFDDDNMLAGAINVFQDITALKSTELELRESQHRYKEVIELLPTAVYTCDSEGRIQLYNKAAADLWGRAPEVGKDLWCGSWKIFSPEDGTPVPLDTCPMAVALKEGRPVLNKEIVVERPDGIRRNVAPNPRPLFDSSGRVVGAVNMLIDITEQKNASKALRESEQKFRMIANLAPVIIWMTDSTGQCIYLNPQWNAMTGRALDAGTGNKWLSFVHPDESPEISRQWDESFAALRPFNCVFGLRNIDGDFVTHQAVAIPRYDDNESFIGYIGIFQDISAHVKIQQSLETLVRERTEDLRKSEQRYHLMVSEVQDYAIIFLNTDGVIENWNKGAERIKGYHAEEVIGKHFRIFYSLQEQADLVPETFLKRAIAEGKAAYQGWRVRKDGSMFWGHVILTTIRDASNVIIGFSKVTRDLTEMKAAEDELKAYAQKLMDKNLELEKMNQELGRINQELSSFAHISSHDLQEPLRKIQTFSARILEMEETKLSDKSKDYFTRMTAAARRMRMLIDDLLAYSRANISERKFISTDLNEVLQNAQIELKETIEGTRAKIYCSPLPVMQLIPLQIEQLMINLLSNSLKFTKPGTAPIIKVNAMAVSGRHISHHYARPDKTYMCISITDNGIGFEPAFNSKIFEIFQRLHNRNEYEGTGVGLAICKKIAENHNGFISATSDPGKGATFNIYLPADANPNAH